jgi:hypothetical protein
MADRVSPFLILNSAKKWEIGSRTRHKCEEPLALARVKPRISFDGAWARLSRFFPNWDMTEIICALARPLSFHP